MRTRACLLTLAAGGLLLLGSPGPARAQVTRADSAAVLLQAAGQLEARGERGAAAALLRLVVDHFAGTPAARAAEERLAEVYAARRSAAEAADGRTELLVWGTLYGAWLGIAVPGALGADDAEAYGAGLLAGLPVGFFLSRAYAAAARPSVGQARAVTFGGTWGTWQGMGWRAVLDIGEAEECPEFDPACIVDDDPIEETFLAGIAGGLAGIGAGAWVASRAEITPGTATLVNFGALWGTWYGAVAGAQVGFLDDDDGDRYLATLLLAGDAGLLATAVMAPGWNMSRSRARMINIAGVAGLVGGFALDLLIQPDDVETVLLIPGITSVAGLVAGRHWTRDMDARGDLERDGGEPGGAALLRFRNGAMALSAPTPRPMLLRESRPDGRPVRSPALALPLIEARF